ncbi:MAG: hypothetical protein R2991_11400 [Thermoanaerobaculia bacterium]
MQREPHDPQRLVEPLRDWAHRPAAPIDRARLTRGIHNPQRARRSPHGLAVWLAAGVALVASSLLVLGRAIEPGAPAARGDRPEPPTDESLLVLQLESGTVLYVPLEGESR